MPSSLSDLQASHGVYFIIIHISIFSVCYVFAILFVLLSCYFGGFLCFFFLVFDFVQMYLPLFLCVIYEKKNYI